MTVRERMRASPTGERDPLNAAISAWSIKVFSSAIADCTRVVAENFVKGDDVICNQRSFISFECGLHLRDDFGQINLHNISPQRIALISVAAAQQQYHLLQACRPRVALCL